LDESDEIAAYQHASVPFFSEDLTAKVSFSLAKLRESRTLSVIGY
jgi:hypothetical protein